MRYYDIISDIISYNYHYNKLTEIRNIFIELSSSGKEFCTKDSNKNEFHKVSELLVDYLPESKYSYKMFISGYKYYKYINDNKYFFAERYGCYSILNQYSELVKESLRKLESICEYLLQIYKMYGDIQNKRIEGKKIKLKMYAGNGNFIKQMADCCNKYQDYLLDTIEDIEFIRHMHEDRYQTVIEIYSKYDKDNPIYIDTVTRITRKILLDIQYYQNNLYWDNSKDIIPKYEYILDMFLKEHIYNWSLYESYKLSTYVIVIGMNSKHDILSKGSEFIKKTL